VRFPAGLCHHGAGFCEPHCPHVLPQQEEDAIMSDENSQRITGRRADYSKWVIIFCLGVLVFLGLFYYATQKIQV
jgi:hypothetical protein